METDWWMPLVMEWSGEKVTHSFAPDLPEEFIWGARGEEQGRMLIRVQQEVTQAIVDDLTARGGRAASDPRVRTTRTSVTLRSR